jgi:DNA-binding transcriptional ArsR family regulator
MDPFEALSNPIRRQIIERLSDGEMPVLEIAQPFKVTLGALSQHLKILKAARLVTKRKQGRQRIYCLSPEPIHEVYLWASQYEKFWKERLAKLGEVLRKRHEDNH